MTSMQRLYDVYVSYPPDQDREHINAFLRDNLSDEEANDIINALAEQRQAIIAERCTEYECQNAQHYFSYLGLDVIIRLSLEFADDHSKLDSINEDNNAFNDSVPQCPVCYTILEDFSVRDCPTCGQHLDNLSEATLQRKRIEWQERIAFEHRKKHEIAYKLLREKQEEEKQLRKQIRAELEEQLMVELGQPEGWRQWLRGKYIMVIGFALAGILTVLALFYIAAQLFFSDKSSSVKTNPPAEPVTRTINKSHSVDGATGSVKTTQSSNNVMAAAPISSSTPLAQHSNTAAKPVVPIPPKHQDLPEVSVPTTQPINPSHN